MKYECDTFHRHTHRDSREQQSADARDYSARVPSVCSCALNYFLSYIIFIHFVKSLGAWNRWVLKIQKCSVRYSSIVVLVRIVFSLFHFRVRLLRLPLLYPRKFRWSAHTRSLIERRISFSSHSHFSQPIDTRKDIESAIIVNRNINRNMLRWIVPVRLAEIIEQHT